MPTRREFTSALTFSQRETDYIGNAPVRSNDTGVKGVKGQAVWTLASRLLLPLPPSGGNCLQSGTLLEKGLPACRKPAMQKLQAEGKTMDV